MGRVHVGLKIEADEKARLQAEADAAGVTLSEWCRRVLATGFGRRAALPRSIASHDEVLELLSAAARAGDVQAMKHLDGALKRSAPAEPEKPASPLDELAARRKKVTREP